MNLQQAGQPKSSNGYGHRKSEREGATKSENKILSGKLNANRLANAVFTGAVTGSKGGSYESPSHDRLVYVTTCLIGHQVEVQVKNGSIYSGIFHATNTDKDFGIILKMARLTKDGSLRGQKSGTEFVSKPPLKILIIPAKDLVQVTAQDVAITRDGLANESHHDMHQEIMVDSLISQSRHVDLGRELKPWVPDEEDPQCPELENIFDGHWNRGWDQFETNEALFGVKSTFNEELYTTKLEKGPQTRELEKQALRIAREIEGEETQDLHLAEERGLHLHEAFDIDEETRFSSVYRGKHVDDSGFDEDILFDSHNSETFGDETFGGVFGSVVKRPGEISGGKGNDGARTLANSSSMDHTQSCQSNTCVDLSRSGSYDHAKQLASELPAKSYSTSDGESRIQENLNSNQHGDNAITKEENPIQVEEDVQLSRSEDSQGPLYSKKDGSDKGVLSPNASSYAPSSHTSSKTHEKMGSHGDLIEGSASGKANGETKSVNSRGIPSGSDLVGGIAASSVPGLSPSSSVCSLSSEKSTLNPNAKEFKLNPNAKSFIPSPARPPTPVSDGSFYFPTNVTTVPSMPGMPVGIGIGPTFAGPQPIIYNPQVAQMPSQGYFHPNAPQYGQLLGHPRQSLYMPSYLPEMQYKGRDY
ncbi:polyadenylate-binding protein-interacting protein 3-like isoform X1 [Glycine soja]|uniref:Polyadenylate-binding protein-interacting protein 3 isoform A n=1 Tax=Glycine soja TaxID=3848 RepID=A0A445IED5_GLYSO|nr:polyadenylate-binding protein-interacting protein 3-like isoform X1 [Glycine soja]XP_028189952.1 polyadenylate-binding protein-interacting protein 3-like isoform X1 [Glycine soja]RZB84421.1 Polyadenylate-binding protein-interacting protein 3 isoform A [Glycine soja]